MRTARALLMLFLLIASTTPVQTQTALDLNEGLLITPELSQGDYTLSWWGRDGKTYFIQQSDDLVNWTYLPVIESGHDAVLSYGIASAAHWSFFRLRIVDEATSTPPADVDLLAVGTESIRVTWTAGDATQPTTLEFSTDFGLTWQTVGVVAAGVITATITGLPTDHSLSVRARTGGTATSTAAAPAFDAPTATPPSGAPVSAPSDSATTSLSSEPMLLTKKIESKNDRYGFAGFTDDNTRYLKFTRHVVEMHNASITSDTTYTTTVNKNTGEQTSTPPGSSVIPGYGSGWGNISNTSHQRTNPLSGIGNTQVVTETLETPYTAGELQSTVEGAFPAYPGNFQPANPPSDSSELAFAQIINPPDGLNYLVQKLKYKWAIPKTPGQVLRWFEVFTPRDGPPIITPMSWLIDGVRTETDEFVIDPTTSNGKMQGNYSVLRIEFALRDRNDVEKGWDNTGSEPWTSVGIGKTNSIIKCVGATDAFELAVETASVGKLSIANTDINEPNTSFDITGLTDSLGLGSGGAKIVLRQKNTTTVYRTLHVHVLPSRTVHFTVYHASDEGPGRVPNSAIPENVATPGAIQTELNRTFKDQANIEFVANLLYNPIAIANCDGAFATDGVCYKDLTAYGHNISSGDLIEGKARTKAQTLGVTWATALNIVIVKDVTQYSPPLAVQGLTPHGQRFPFVDAVTNIQTIAHETGHALHLSTKIDPQTGAHHDTGTAPDGGKPLMHAYGAGHWIRQEDWREANDYTGQNYQ